MSTAAEARVTDLIAESLLPGQEDRIRELFNAQNLRAPEIIWSPGDSELRSPLHRRFAAICQSRAVDGQIPASGVSVEDFGTLSGWLIVIDVLDDGEDFLYEHYGHEIAEYSGLDMTGKRVSDFGGYLATFYTGLYKAVLSTQQWVFSEHEPPKDIFVRSWQRLIVPLVDDRGDVTRLLTLNVPDSEMRVGLELMVDPVFVVGADGKVIFHNRAAQVMFHLPASHARKRSLGDLTGIALEIDMTPEDLLNQNRVVESIELTSTGSIIERLSMTVSAAQHRGQAFFVVVMRMIGT